MHITELATLDFLIRIFCIGLSIGFAFGFGVGGWFVKKYWSE